MEGLLYLLEDIQQKTRTKGIFYVLTHPTHTMYQSAEDITHTDMDRNAANVVPSIEYAQNSASNSSASAYRTNIAGAGRHGKGRSTSSRPRPAHHSDESSAESNNDHVPLIVGSNPVGE